MIKMITDEQARKAAFDVTFRYWMEENGGEENVFFHMVHTSKSGPCEIEYMRIYLRKAFEDGYDRAVKDMQIKRKDSM